MDTCMREHPLGKLEVTSKVRYMYVGRHIGKVH